MDTNSRLREAQREIHHFLTDERKMWEAVQAPGATFSLAMGETQLPEGNKRLALVGDSVIRMALVDAAYAISENRGRTQNRISIVARNSNLANVGRKHSIHKCINPAAGTIEISNGTVADTVEAIIGAVFLDGGLDAAKEVMTTLGLLE